ncbi:MAG TPA: DUF2085 domain-containing protein, partial [Vicinamibacterales bacterium]|nr:DUF2085 domain-containing protein [Vicinamibacterales bacterium]
MDLLTAFAYAVGGVICHQQPERSFFWDGQQLPVCARCAGLYLSGMGGAIAWLAIKLRARGRPIAWRADRALRTLLIASVPTALSVVSA